jgi:hypothetical protein
MRAALRRRQRVAVEILLRTGMRAGNLVALDLDRHLVRIRGAPVTACTSSIPGEEVKNGEDLAFELARPTACACWRPTCGTGGRSWRGRQPLPVPRQGARPQGAPPARRARDS